MTDHAQILDPATVRLERVLPGPIERVWQFLTDSDKRAKWLAAGEFELRPGGVAELRFDHGSLSAEKDTPERFKANEGHSSTGTVLACEPPRLLTLTWGGPDDASEVSFELTPAESGKVLLVLTQRRLRTRDELIGTAAGWYAHLAILVDILEERTPRGFWSTLDLAEKEYERRIKAMDA